MKIKNMKRRGSRQNRSESTPSEDTVAGGKDIQTPEVNQNGKLKYVFNVIGFRFLSVYMTLYNIYYIQ